MNWILFPHTGKVNLRGESNFILYEDLARYLASKGDYVYFVVPDWIKDEEMLLPKESVAYVKIPLSGAYYVDMAVSGDQLVRRFNRKIGTSFVDGVFTSKPFIVPYLAVGLGDSQRSDVPIQYFEPGIDIKFGQLARPTNVDQSAWYLINGAYLTGYPIFLTQAELDSAKEYMMHYVQASHVRKLLDERAVVLPVGLPKDILNKHKGTEKNETFTLFFGARVNNQKRADDVVKLYNLFYESGRDVKIVICTSTPDMLAKRYIGKEKLFQNKQIELHTDMGREKYLELAAKAHVFVAHSKLEGFPIGFWEQMYLDIIGVFVRERWALAQIPADYPFQYNTIEEAYTILSWIFDNYDEALEKLRPLQKKTDDFETKVIHEKVRERGLKYMDLPHQWRITTGAKELLDQVLPEMADRFSMDELLTKMQKVGRHFPKLNAERARTYFYPSDYDLYRYLQANGYKCEMDMEKDEAWFQKS